MPKGVYVRKQEDKDRISKWMSERYANGEKIGFKKGNKFGYARAGSKRLDMVGVKNLNWLGEDAGYGSKHKWISYNFGKASECQNILCKGENLKRFEWANISGDHKRDRSDYIQLCVPCHRRWDMGLINIKTKPDFDGLTII